MAPREMAIGVGSGELRFLYVGVADTGASLAQWTGGMGATLRWRFQHFGADVAGLDLTTGSPSGPDRRPSPVVMLADHRPAGSVLPIWAVPDLAAATDALRSAGWSVAGPMGTPEGDAIVATDAAGVEIALLEVTRPGAMDGAYADDTNTHRVGEAD